MDCFKDKVVLITGASSGIGRGTAEEFAKAGATLGLTGRNEENLKITAKKCQDLGLPQEKIYLATGDLTKEEDVNRIVDGLVDKFGTIHILVNNAGSMISGTFQNVGVSDMDAMYNTNVRSVFMVTHRALPHIIQNKGSIVNVSSLLGIRPVPYCFVYTVSKAAVNHFTQTLAMELAAKGVRVNAVNPAVIETDIFIRPGGQISATPEKFDEFMALMGSAHPIGRVGRVEEVAQAVMFLASDAASYITGTLLPVDGGRAGTISTPDLQLLSKK